MAKKQIMASMSARCLDLVAESQTPSVGRRCALFPAVIRAILTAASFAMLSLGTASEVRAAQQTWQFTMGSTITVNGLPQPLPTQPILPIDVQSSGSFQFQMVISPSATCPGGGAVNVTGL